MGFWKRIFGKNNIKVISSTTTEERLRKFKTKDTTNYPKEKQLYLNNLESAKRELEPIQNTIHYSTLYESLRILESFISKVEDQPNTKAWLDMELFQVYREAIAKNIDNSITNLNKANNIKDKESIISKLRSVGSQFK